MESEVQETISRSAEEIASIKHAVSKVNLAEQKEMLREVFSHEYLRALNLTMEVREIPYYKHRVEGTHRLEIIFTPDKVNESGEMNQSAVSRREFEADVRASSKIKPNWFQRTFKIIDGRNRVKHYTIKGYNRRATTYPVICDCVANGRVTEMKCSENFVCNGLLQA